MILSSRPVTLELEQPDELEEVITLSRNYALQHLYASYVAAQDRLLCIQPGDDYKYLVHQRDQARNDLCVNFMATMFPNDIF